MANNKLKINCEKTEFMVMTSKQQKSKCSLDTLNVCGDSVKRVGYANNLGLTIDEQMDMNLMDKESA